MQQILEKFNRLRTEQIAIAANYEKNQSYEMAYIALWSILETGLKDITPRAKTIVLLEKTIEWKDYLEGNGRKPQKEITPNEFKCTRSDKIPPISLIEKLLGDCPIIKEILNQKTAAQSGATKEIELPTMLRVFTILTPIRNIKTNCLMVWTNL